MFLLPLFSAAALALWAMGAVAGCALLSVAAAVAALALWAIGVVGVSDVSGGVCELVWC